MGIILVSLTENMISTANLERLHEMCQPSTMTLQSRASFQFSGLARKIFLPLPCLTLSTTELSRTRSANICTAHHSLAEAVSQFAFVLRDSLHWPHCQMPRMRDKHIFFSQLLHTGSNILYTYPEQLWPPQKRSWVFRKLFSHLWYSAQQRACHTTAAALAEMPCAPLTYWTGTTGRTRRMKELKNAEDLF